jgi:uncharacterized cupin superfamily protein
MTDEKPPAALVAADLPERSGSSYLKPYDEPVQGRAKRVLGNPFGLSQFGVNLVTMKPGAWSSQRHWHENEDEFIYVLEGELTLMDDGGPHVLTPGMCAGFKAGVANGHHLINNTAAPATYLEVGTRADNEHAHYSDIDMEARKTAGKWQFFRKGGGPL